MMFHNTHINYYIIFGSKSLKTFFPHHPYPKICMNETRSTCVRSAEILTPLFFKAGW